MDRLEALDRFLEVPPPPGNCPAWQEPEEDCDRQGHTYIAGIRNLKKPRSVPKRRTKPKRQPKDLPPVDGTRRDADEVFWDAEDLQEFAECPYATEVNGRLQNNHDAWVCYRVGLAAISGGLEEAKTTEDLISLAEQGQRLLSAGIVEVSRLKMEIRRVLYELARWGEEVDRQLRKAHRSR